MNLQIFHNVFIYRFVLNIYFISVREKAFFEIYFIGNIKQSMNEDRNENDHDFQTIPFNPNKSLSIEQQRLRLPIHNVRFF